MAAIARPFSGARLLARLRPRHDFHQQAADAEPGNVLARHRQPGEKPHQHPVETVFLRAPRAARRTDHRSAGGGADHHQIAGIDRHAEMLDRAADVLKRRRDDIAPVGDRGGAEYDGELSTGFEHFVERLGERRAIMRYAPFGDDRGAGGRQPLGGDFQRLVDHLGGGPGSRSTPRRPCECDKARPATAALGAGHAASRADLATANGMIFTVAIISPATTGL